MRVLIVDNHDSFTWNIAHALGRLGARVEVRLSDGISPAEILRRAPERLVLSPGGGTPDQAGMTLDIVRACTGRLPILGVCLGMQAIAQAAGARLQRSVRPLHGKTTLVHHDGHGLFSGLATPFPAMRYNSLAIDRTSLPADLEVSAWSPEGEPMALRRLDATVVGLQFHPESFMTPVGPYLLAAFLQGRFAAIPHRTAPARPHP